MTQNRYTYEITTVPGPVKGHHRWWITVEDVEENLPEPSGLCLLFSPACSYEDAIAVRNLLRQRRIKKASVKKLRKVKRDAKKYKL